MVDNETQEVVQQEEVDNQEEHIPEVIEQEKQEKKTADINFIRLRKERDDAYRRLQELESKQQKPEEQEEESFSINPDDLVEGKHLSKYDKKIKQLEEKLSSYQKQSSVSNADTRLKNQYPDIEKVVTADTIAALRESYPEIASTLSSAQDYYTQAASTYTLIKKLGIYT
jgi:hypothetical protein